jgi:hypothetical protein
VPAKTPTTKTPATKTPQAITVRFLVADAPGPITPQTPCHDATPLEMRLLAVRAAYAGAGEPCPPEALADAARAFRPSPDRPRQEAA